MFLRLFVLGVITSSINFSKMLAQLPFPDQSAYQLTFSEEFNNQNYTSKWYPIWGWNQRGFWDLNVLKSETNTLESYCGNIPSGRIDYDINGYRTRNYENCIINPVGSGTLTIQSRKEIPTLSGEVWTFPDCDSPLCDGKRPCTDAGGTACLNAENKNFNYSTGILISKEAFRFGYFEIRCKIDNPILPDTKTGVGPNFWMYSGEQRDSVIYSELDIFEFSGKTNKFQPNLHYGYGDIRHNGEYSNKHSGEIDKGEKSVVDANYHIYSCLWTPQSVIFYFDNVPYDTIYKYVDKLVPMNMIIDVNLPVHTQCELIDATTKFPHNFDIDYVRVYQKTTTPCDNNNLLVSQNGQLQSGSYSNVTVNPPLSGISIPTSTNLDIKFQKEVLINSTFITGSNSNILIQSPKECLQSEHYPLPTGVQRSANIDLAPNPIFYEMQKLKHR